jgi:hypothetical protein
MVDERLRYFWVVHIAGPDEYLRGSDVPPAAHRDADSHDGRSLGHVDAFRMSIKVMRLRIAHHGMMQISYDRSSLMSDRLSWVLLCTWNIQDDLQGRQLMCSTQTFTLNI